MFNDIYTNLENIKKETWEKLNSASAADDESSALQYIKVIHDIKSLIENIKSCEEKYNVITKNLTGEQNKFAEIKITKGAISQSYLTLGSLKNPQYNTLIPKNETNIKITTYIDDKKNSEFETEFIHKLSRFKDRKNIRLFYQECNIKENEKITFTEITKDKHYKISYTSSDRASDALKKK